MFGRMNVVKIVVVGAIMAVLMGQTLADGHLLRLGVSEVIDHSHIVDESIPTLGGPLADDNVQFTVVAEPPATPYTSRRLDNLLEQYGTHVSAPFHYGGSGRDRLDEIAAGDLVGDLCVLDVRAQVLTNPDYEITVEDLQEWEATYGRIPDGAIVAMYSGWATRWGSESAYRNADTDGVLHYPGWGVGAIAFLLDGRNILGVGVDTLSVDSGASADYDSEFRLMTANKYTVSNLNNLGDAPARGGVVVIGAPNLRDGTGSTARVFTLVLSAAPAVAVPSAILLLAMLLLAF